MRRLRRWGVRLFGLFDRGRHEREIQDEIESHLALHIDDNVRRGMTPGEARRRAVLDLGGIQRLKEQQRDGSGVPALQHLWRDLMYAARVLRRSPTFSLVIIATLGLCIGANTAIFTIVNAVLLDPLPYPRADRLVLVWNTDGRTGSREVSVSYPDFEQWRDSVKSFSALAALTGRGVTLKGADLAEVVPAIQTTPEFFQILGIEPIAGRLFTATDAMPDGVPVAVLSEAAWRRLFGGTPEALGTSIAINGRPHVVIGIAPSALHFLATEAEQVYTLLPRETNRAHAYLRVLGRLKDGATVAAAQAELDVLTRQTAAAFPETHAFTGANVVSLVDAVGVPVRDGLILLLAIVGVVLLIACANIANLTLARHAARQHEIALRVSLGATTGRVLQQLSCESLVLALAGGAAGLVIGQFLVDGLLIVLGSGVPVPRVEAIRMDRTVLLFCLATSVATGLLFGLGSSFVTMRNLAGQASREASRTIAGGRSGYRVRATLVVVESALALILLAAAATFARAFIELRATAPGFVTDDVLAIGIRVPGSLGPGEAREAFFSDVLTRLGTLPGVQSAGFVSSLPMAGGSDSLQFRVEGDPTAKPRSADVNLATAGYFRTLRVPVVAGREFSRADGRGAPLAVVVNEAAARRFWPGRDPIGQRLTFTGESTPHTVVGIVGDVRQSDLATAPRPELYLCASQPGPDWSTFALTVRVDDGRRTIVADVRAALRTANPDVAIIKVAPLEEILTGRLALPRVYTALSTSFALLALLLAAVGLYGVIAYSVAQRTRELGVRLALGSAPSALSRSVLRQALTLTAMGVAIGLVGALFLVQATARVLPSVRPEDPITLALVATMMLIVAAAAAYFPARRAARVDPLIALRAD